MKLKSNSLAKVLLQQATSNKQQATKLNLVLLLTLFICYSCKKNNSETIYKTDVKSTLSSTPQTGIGSEGLMEFAPQTPNPYTLANMQAALDSLSQRADFNCDKTKFVVRTTHKYIKFKPIDSILAGILVQDTTLSLFDYPLDRKITKGGTYYRAPDLPASQPNYQWTCVPANKTLPNNVPYDVLANLYIPEEDPNLVPYYNTAFDDCITRLIEEALIRTGNFDTTAYYGGVTNASGSSKFTPAGTIRLTDNVLNTNHGLHGVKIKVHRYFEIRECLTDINGNYNMSHRFRFPVNYSIKWDRNDYSIRNGSFGQAYFNGPYKKGNWDVDINSGISWHFGQVHRGAFDYYYNNPTGLRTPPTNGFLGSRIAIGVCDEKGRACYRHWQKNWFGPEIRMYNKWENGSQRDAQDQYRTTIHELAHASHFNMSHWHYRNDMDDMVKESWAVGVAVAFEKIKYSPFFNWQGILLSDIPTTYEKKYTPLVTDLIDNFNQRIENGGNLDFPIDKVSGYNIRTIEDALKEKRTMETWRDQLKNNKPSGVTDSQLDELFNNYIPLR